MNGEAGRAWSLGEPGEVLPFREYHPWPVALRWSGAALVVGTGVAAAAFLIPTPSSDFISSEPTTVEWSASPEPPVPTLSAPPDVRAQPLTKDGEYLTAVRKAGIDIEDGAAAITWAHGLCTYLDQPGVTLPAYVTATWNTFPGSDYQKLLRQAVIGQLTYCPKGLP